MMVARVTCDIHSPRVEGNSMKSKVSETQYDSLAEAKADVKFSRQQPLGHATLPTIQRMPPCGLSHHTMNLENATATTETKVERFACSCGKGLIRRKGSRKPCKTCNAPVVLADAEKERFAMTKRDVGTCRKLFCAGETEEQGFSRAIAVNYLVKRMVYSPRGNGKGHADKTGGKTSSSRHILPFFTGTDIEDIVNEAYLIYMGHGISPTGAPLAFKRTGNRLNDTCNAARRAHTCHTQQRRRERLEHGIDFAAYIVENKDRSKRNVTWDDELEALLNAVRLEGTADQTTLAAALGISQGEVSKRFARIRVRNR